MGTVSFFSLILMVALFSLRSCSNKQGGSLWVICVMLTAKRYDILKIFCYGFKLYISEFLIDEKEVSKEEYADCVDAGICNFPLEGEGLCKTKEKTIKSC